MYNALRIPPGHTGAYQLSNTCCNWWVRLQLVSNPASSKTYQRLSSRCSDWSDAIGPTGRVF